MITPWEFKLKSAVLDISRIHRWSSVTHNQRRSNTGYNQVFGFLLIIVKSEAQTVIQHPEVNTQVYLFGSFPLQIIVTGCRWQRTCFIRHITGHWIIDSRQNRSIIHIVCQTGDTTILSPACTQLQMRDWLEVFHKFLVGKYPADRHSREIAPTFLQRKDRQVGCIRTKGELGKILACIVIRCPAKVRKIGIPPFLSTTYRTGGSTGPKSKIGIIGIQLGNTQINLVAGTATIDSSRHSKGSIGRIGHTKHHVYIVLICKCLGIVGKVFPLPVRGVGACRTYRYIVLIKVRAGNVRHNIAVGIAVSITVSQTWSDDQLFNRSKIQISGAAEHKTISFRCTTVTHNIRIDIIGVTIRGNRIIITIGILKQGMPLVHIINHSVGQFIRCIGNWSKRVKLNGRQHQRTGCWAFAYRLYMITGKWIVCRELQPILYFIICIDSAGNTVKNVLIAYNGTIVA